MKTVYFIAKKKTEPRWIAYKFKNGQRPEPKTGYEMKGPFPSLIQALIAANSK